jgi:hypothetical protein
MSYKISNLSGIILHKGLIPKDHGPFTKIIIIPNGFAFLSHPILRTILKLLCLFITW